jgi:hypothetical protein
MAGSPTAEADVTGTVVAGCSPRLTHHPRSVREACGRARPHRTLQFGPSARGAEPVPGGTIPTRRSGSIDGARQ